MFLKMLIPLRTKTWMAVCAILSLLLTLLIHGGKVASETIPQQPVTAKVTPSSDLTVIANPITFTIFDNGGQVDGDDVRIKLNEQIIPGGDGVRLRGTGQRFSIQLQPGINTLSFTAVNEGTSPPNTAGVIFNSSQVIIGNITFSLAQSTAQTKSITLKFPQIRIPPSRYPESAAHVRDAQALGFPRILTIDRGNNATTRRQQSIANYLRNGGKRVAGKDLDEYPPAVFVENRGRADVRPVTFGDNRGAGAFMAGQLQGYGSTKIYLNNGYKVELVARN